MAKKKFGRKFSTKEKILVSALALILLGAAYYFFIWTPSMDALHKAENQITNVQDQIAEAQIVSAQMVQIKKEIEAAEERGIKACEFPPADNTKGIMDELNGILSSTKSFTISFTGEETQGHITRRNAKVSFTVDDYEKAEEVLRDILGCRYSCMITDFSITRNNASTVSSKTGNCVVVAEVVFFENAKESK